MRPCEVKRDAYLICALPSGALPVSAAAVTGHTAVRAEALHSVRVGDEDQLEAIPRCPGCSHVHVPAAGPRPRTHRCKRALTMPPIWTAAHIAAASMPPRCRSQRLRLRFGLGHGAAEPTHGTCENLSLYTRAKFTCEPTSRPAGKLPMSQRGAGDSACGHSTCISTQNAHATCTQTMPSITEQCTTASGAACISCAHVRPLCMQ